MKKTSLRIPLDILLIVLFSTVFSKNVISLMYHEVVGLGLFALVILHLFLNSAWIKGVCLKLFDQSLPKKTRVIAAVDILLFISFFLIIVTGVLISKKLFGFGLKAPWIVIHFFCTALMIVLMGIHIGLHWGYLKKHLPKLPKVAALVLTVVICAFGICSMFTSSFGTWLSRPFVKFEGYGSSGGGQEYSQEKQADEGTAQADRGQGQEEQTMNGERSGGRDQQPFSVMRLLNLVATYYSILFAIGKITNIVDERVKRKRVLPA